MLLSKDNKDKEFSRSGECFGVSMTTWFPIRWNKVKLNANVIQLILGPWLKWFVEPLPWAGYEIFETEDRYQVY